MVECVVLSDTDSIPGTDTAKKSVAHAKREFNPRVAGWFAELSSKTATDLLRSSARKPA